MVQKIQLLILTYDPRNAKIPDPCNAKIPASYEDLDWGEPAQGRGSEIEPKCLILISNLELSRAKAGRNRGFL